MEIDLLKNYPKTKRDVASRGASKTEEERKIARMFGKEFFDGERKTGYGGFSYHPRFWQPVIPTFQEHFGLTSKSSVLDVGCAKGFMLHDMREIIPGITVNGIDISSYAIANAYPTVKDFVQVGDARSLPFPDKSFDVVISINTIHNLDGRDLEIALLEIQRVSRKSSFITVDAFSNEAEKELMFAWNLTAKTILHVDEWKNLFKRVGYTGDYYWFKP